MEILRNIGRRRKQLWELLHQVLNHIIADGLYKSKETTKTESVGA